MSKVEMFEKALKRWENLSLDNIDVSHCSFCSKYLRENKCSIKCPLVEYNYECDVLGLSYSTPWDEYSMSMVFNKAEKAKNMHMLIHLIILSEGYEVEYE